MPDETFPRTTWLERNVAAGFYSVVVKVLQSFRFYHARNERYTDLIRDLVGPELRSARVAVDLGCGPCTMTTLLRGPQLLIGIDSDRFFLRQSVAPDLPRIQARAERLPIKSGSVTIAVAISLVEHIADQSAFFRELARILEPRGRVVLQIPELRFPVEPHTKWPLLHVWNSSVQARVLAATGYGELNMSTSIAGVIRFAEAAGLRTNRVVPIWHFRLARISGMPMGYFTLFMKHDD